MALSLTSARPLHAVLGDIVQLAKPRIVLLLLITCLAAMLAACRGNVDLLSLTTIGWTLCGLALTASGANMINMWFDRDIDSLMARTLNRPLPAARMQPETALALGIGCGILGFALLGLLVNPLTALMAASGYLFYVLIYTMLLKRRTVQNIVIGGAAGAFPPLVGWAAVQGNLDAPLPWIMFLIIFLWTPPHFWSLALYANADYTRARIPMLPVVKGDAETKARIVYYFLLLLPVTLMPGLIYPLGPIYAAVAVALGGWWLVDLLRLMYASEDDTRRRAVTAFRHSLYYLALLFAAMVLDSFL